MAEPSNRVAAVGFLGEWRGGLELTLVQGRQQTPVFHGLMGAFHYLGDQQPTGAQLKCLAYPEDRPIACLSFGPAAFKLAPRDRFIGWAARQPEERLPGLVNNDRFLILPSTSPPHLPPRLLRERPPWQGTRRPRFAVIGHPCQEHSSHGETASAG